MKNYPLVISGAGGGGGAETPHTPIEFDDTLSSKQRLRMLFVVGEGEIESVDNVFVDGSPISGFDASFEYRTGTVDQTHIPGFAKVETPVITGNVQLVQSVPVIREVSAVAVDAVRITIGISTLFKVEENGDTVGHTVSFAILTRKDDIGLWVLQKTITKTDKGSSLYTMDVRVERPDNAIGTTWQFSVQRTSADDASNKESSDSFLRSYTEIQDITLTYPHSALVGIVFNNADELGGNVPTLSFEGKWRKISVPDATVYDPVARSYTPGAWSGAFALAKISSSCLAWVMYDVLTDGRAGLGILPGDINAFSFFDYAVECDGLVDDGNGIGAFEHRYSIDNQFFRREKAGTFLEYLLTLGNARLANDEFGLISVISDRPAVTTKIVNNSNVIDGLFDYPSSELEETFSWVNVTYNDPNDKYNTTTISEKRQDRIDAFGLITSDIFLVGCKSEGQARRKAKWALYGPDGSAVFKVGLEGMVYRLGEIIEVMDDFLKNVLQQGRIVSASSDANFTTLVLDRPFAFAAEAYSVICYAADGVEVYDAPIIEQNVTTDTINVSVPGPLATDPNPNSSFIIQGDIKSSLFRIVKISEEDSVFSILATRHDPDKWGVIEGGLVNIVPSAPFVSTEGFTVEPVENIQFQEVFASTSVDTISRINVTWDWDIDDSEDLVATFQYTFRRDNLPFSVIRSTARNEFEIADVTPGVYEVVITAYNPRGLRSVPVSQVYSFRIVAAQSTLKPPLNLYVVNTVSTAFSTRDLSISWFYDPLNDDRTIVNDSLLDYVVEIWAGGLLKNSYVREPITDKNGLFTYTFQDNENDHGGNATRSVEVRVYSRDTVGDVSLAAANTFTNSVPAVVSFTLSGGVGVTFIDITPPADPDVAGYQIYRDTSGIDFVPAVGNLKYEGPDNYVSLGGDSGVEYFYKVAAYDSFGKTALNVSGGSSSTTLAADVDKFAFTGLGFTPNSPVVNSVSWLAGTVSINGATPVAIAAGDAAWAAGSLYLYFDKATVSIGSTTDITIAVQKAQIIAVYEGGENLKGGDGTAFFNGSQLIAKSIGAGQLVVDTAIITAAAQIAALIVEEAHLNNASVTNAKIGQFIQSTNFNVTNKTGWKVDKTTGMIMYDGKIDLIGDDTTFSVKSATTGERMEQSPTKFIIYDAAGVVRVKFGDLT